MKNPCILQQDKLLRYTFQEKPNTKLYEDNNQQIFCRHLNLSNFFYKPILLEPLNFLQMLQIPNELTLNPHKPFPKHQKHQSRFFYNAQHSICNHKNLKQLNLRIYFLIE